jgi:peroxiredoxin
MPLLKRVLFFLAGTLSLTFAFLLLFASGLPERALYSGQMRAGELPVAPEVKALAPPFQQSTLAGSVNLLDLRGSPIILNFWATWCEPCKIEMPDLQKVYEDNRDTGLSVIGVNLGEPEPLIHQWADTFDLTFDLVIDPQQEIAALYRLRGQPSTYVIDPQGIITHIFYGPVTAETLQNAIAPYVVSR